MRRFPALEVRSLAGGRRTLPDDLPPGPRIVLLLFQRWHTTLIEQWQTVVEGLKETCPLVDVWDVATLSEMYSPARGFIDGGMAAGTPDADAREHTLTAYTKLGKLADELDLPSLETGYVFLLTSEGEIAWRSDGSPDEAKVAELEAALAALCRNGDDR